MITKKQVKGIVKHYGTFRKWEFNPNVKQLSAIIHLREKLNNHLWLVINQRDDGIEVTFSNGKGLIVKRDKWFIADDKVAYRKISKN